MAMSALAAPSGESLIVSKGREPTALSIYAPRGRKTPAAADANKP